MKLPPLALTAPSLCPRCDAPAMFDDHCVQCALPLRLCGACHGVAGPFDRFCGFCGYELVQGDKRAPVWRLWLVLALVPLAAGLAFGLSPAAMKIGPVARLVTGAQATPPATTAFRMTRYNSPSLGFEWALPADWKATDYTLGQPPQPYVVASQRDSDRQAPPAEGELISVGPQGPVMTLGRPPLDVTAVDTSNPQAVLGFQVSQLLASPPSGVTLRVVKPVHAISVGGKPGAEVLLAVTSGERTTYYERVYIASGSRPLFRVEAVAPAASWDTGDADRVEAVVHSIAFTR
jgi:hypothetical protein